MSVAPDPSGPSHAAVVTHEQAMGPMLLGEQYPSGPHSESSLQFPTGAQTFGMLGGPLKFGGRQRQAWPPSQAVSWKHSS